MTALLSRARYALALLCAVVVFGSLEAKPAQAQWGYGCGAFYPYAAEHLPYFSVYPPVYYSHPVPRTYGYSPFAYPPGVMTPEFVDDGKAEVINPYVPKEQLPTEKRDKTMSNRTTGGPQVIINPYVVSDQTTTATSVAETPPDRSQNVFPAKTASIK